MYALRSLRPLREINIHHEAYSHAKIFCFLTQRRRGHRERLRRSRWPAGWKARRSMCAFAFLRVLCVSQYSLRRLLLHEDFFLTQSRRVHRERLRCSRWPAGGYIQAIAMYALRSLRPLRETYSHVLCERYPSIVVYNSLDTICQVGNIEID